MSFHFIYDIFHSSSIVLLRMLANSMINIKPTNDCGYSESNDAIYGNFNPNKVNRRQYNSFEDYEDKTDKTCSVVEDYTLKQHFR